MNNDQISIGWKILSINSFHIVNSFSPLFLISFEMVLGPFFHQCNHNLETNVIVEGGCMDRDVWLKVSSRLAVMASSKTLSPFGPVLQFGAGTKQKIT